MVELFIKGGPFMWPILGVFIIALIFVFERLFTLTKTTLATNSFLKKVDAALKNNGVKEAIEVCRNTPGSVSQVYLAGLSRAEKGTQAVEKAIESAGSIEMSFLEKNMVWLTTAVTIAPMLGFTGTVSGMVSAFDAIAAANDISPAVVAGGISQALLTTLFGLIVAMIVQVMQNVFTWMIDKLIVRMEETSIDLIDTLENMNETN
ncbi:MAG: MotA/TolQ/ExbB proton channel family protein [Lentisphaeria bacterium]|nr:MotA/TolQ/ExbB proton channel family protein [Candidatus Neomarinimicrobiota bacterium]MCF7842665.1 MotA/TolQ/ExbB proton channel family protein [Lentisphaeria bacterium]